MPRANAKGIWTCIPREAQKRLEASPSSTLSSIVIYTSPLNARALPRTPYAGSRVSENNSSRKFADQARLPTPRYRMGMRAYAYGFPTIPLLGSSLNGGHGIPLQRRSKSLTRGRSWKHETYSEHLRQQIVRATEPGFLGHLCVRYIGSTIMTDAVGRHSSPE
jgi:hypothetical protein